MTKTIIADNFWNGLLGFHGKGKYLNEIKLSVYRIHTDGIWSLKEKDLQLRSKIRIYKLLSNYYKNSGSENLSRYFHNRSHEVFKNKINSKLNRWINHSYS